MSNDKASSPPLVWVKDGKTLHPALLLEADPQSSLVQWSTTMQTEWVESDRVHLELSPRQRQRGSGSAGATDGSSVASPEKISASLSASRKRPRSTQRKATKSETPSTSCMRGRTKKTKARSSSANLPNNSKVKPQSAGRPTQHSPSRTTDQESDSDDLPLVDLMDFSKISSSADNQDESDSNDFPLGDLASEGDSDDDVEVLFTVRPPSPISRPRPVSRSPPKASIATHIDDDDTEDDRKPPAKIADTKPNHPHLGDDENENDLKPPVKKSQIAVAAKRPAREASPPQDSASRRTTPCSSFAYKPGARTSLLQDATRVSFGESNVSDSLLTKTSAAEEARNSGVGNLEASKSSEAIADGAESSEVAGEPTQYALRTSAYLQNLAEICFTVTQDRRWRVGGAEMQPLFQWEDGDDLSVVTALSRHFIPRPPPVTFECTCLLCRDEKPESADSSDPKYAGETACPLIRYEEQLQQRQDRVETKRKDCTSSCTTEPVPVMDEAAKIHSATDDSCVSVSSLSVESTNQAIAESPEVRSLYLYSRLFYRKGPWFRLDDVYKKYYIPKARAMPLQETSDSDKSKAPTTAAPDGAAKPEIASKFRFFQSMTGAGADTATNEKANTSPIVDKDLLRKHLEVYVPRLIADISGLHGSGMIRFFNDEAECGKTVGLALLTAEERGVVLSKLGAGKKRPRAPDAFQNEVWKQMNQQQSIFASQSKDKKTNVLPVRRHVEALLLDCLAMAIVQACSLADYVPAQVMRANSLAVKSSIQKLMTEQFHCTDTRCEGMCFRLREAPTLTLQRCARLYMCATSGPGDMRGSGTNGWRSIRVLREVNVRNAPLGRVLPPPGQHTWHQVQYPCLSHCFGISPACFINAYTPLLVGDDLQLDVQHSAEQVFSSMEAFRCWELTCELRANVDYLVELNESLRYEKRRRARGKEPRHGNGDDATTRGSVDCMSLLSESGREVVLGKLLKGSEHLTETRADIERFIQESLPALEGECEKVLGVIGIMALHILRICSKSMPVVERRMIADRPWLRHMSWHACFAYMLFDIIPVMERRALYPLSVQSLEVLLFGSSHQRSNEFSHSTEHLQLRGTSALAPSLLSRRARGKAADRLIIDYGHMHRLHVAAQDKAAQRVASESFQARIARFCRQIIESTAISSSIGFSAIRTVARRLKQPLAETLSAGKCLESKELGLRFGNPDTDSKAYSKKYSDWTAITDRSVANALVKDENESGARCAFIGFEDDDEIPLRSTSLNVEELAMELYRNGRLPAGDESMPLKGGWTGWHDEGGHVRALFRIICAAPVLGMDFGCSYHRMSDEERHEHATVHLSPYQQAPFDLHVGYEIRTTTTGEYADASIPSRGFYCRRAATIRSFLQALERLSDQCLSDLVYDSILARLNFMRFSKRKDPFLDRDLMQARTLSAVAAGYGGKHLVAIFRCFFFDYRHYSGGLPDLSLFRAIYKCDLSSASERLVVLGDWIGELFSMESQQAMAAKRGAAFLSDRDDEFLGCSKVGDSGGSRASRGGKQWSNSANNTAMTTLPERLRLFHDGHSVKVECMMVEVKSSNDRLDPRQEDWLNVLARYGNARVCKFEDNSKSKKKLDMKTSLI